MTATTACVALMDEDNWTSNTDVLVVADADRKRLTWVPRDLWSERVDNRINTAFATGQLLPALADLGFPCQGLLCLRRGATVAALAGLSVELPVRRPLDFWYPLTPTLPIEQGRKLVSFRPPAELLSGERLHQWIGARYAVDGFGSDLHRLARQGALVRALLRQGADFGLALSNPELVRTEGADPLAVLRLVTDRWRMRIFDQVEDAMIGERMVLRKCSWPRSVYVRAKRLARRTLHPPRPLRLTGRP